MSHRRIGFTIVELLVVAVIIAMLAMLMLAGLSRVRHRAKVDKTKSTIRKINEIIMPQYESYIRRRVPGAISRAGAPDPAILPRDAFSVCVDSNSGNFYGPRAPDGSWPGPFNAATSKKPGRVMAESRLQILRALMIFEMPDSWGDVRNDPTASMVAALPSYTRTGRVTAFAAYKQSLAATLTNAHSSSECLFMLVARGGMEPDVMEQFRDDEIGDTDGDNAPEFLDAWNQPIAFARWAPGISGNVTPPAPQPSLIQLADPTGRHDPIDPMRVDINGYALYPLIFSGGGNQVKGLTIAPDLGWSPLVTTGTSGVALLSITGTNGVITDFIGRLDTVGNASATDVRDNITNHDFSVK